MGTASSPTTTAWMPVEDFPVFDAVKKAPTGGLYSCACYKQCSYTDKNGANTLRYLAFVRAVPGVCMCGTFRLYARSLNRGGVVP